jgi:hypothetical protein
VQHCAFDPYYTCASFVPLCAAADLSCEVTVMLIVRVYTEHSLLYHSLGDTLVFVVNSCKSSCSKQQQQQHEGQADKTQNVAEKTAFLLVKDAIEYCKRSVVRKILTQRNKRTD